MRKFARAAVALIKSWDALRRVQDETSGRGKSLPIVIGEEDALVFQSQAGWPT